MFFYAPTLEETYGDECKKFDINCRALDRHWRMNELYIINNMDGNVWKQRVEHTHENLGETSRMVLNESLTNCNVVSVRKSTVHGLLFLFGGWLIYQNFRVYSVLVVIRFRLLLSVTDVNPRGSETREKVRRVGIYPTQHKVRTHTDATGTEVKAEFGGD